MNKAANGTLWGTQFFPHFYWRIARLPCELLHDLALLDVSEHILSTLEHEYREWNEIAPGYLALFSRDGTIHSFERHFSHIRYRLAEIAKDSTFRLAVATISPSSLEAVDRLQYQRYGKRKSNVKRLELLIMRFLQRLVTKCETHAFAGPVALGRLHSNGNSLKYNLDFDSYTSHCFPSYSLLAGVATALRSLPEFFTTLHVRLSKGCHLIDNCVVHPIFGPIEFGTVFFEAINQLSHSESISVGNLIKIHGVKSEEILSAVSLGILFDEISDAISDQDPLTRLTYLVQESKILDANNIRSLLLSVSQYVHSWPYAGPSRRVQIQTHLLELCAQCGIRMPTRSTYSDHLPIYEDGLLADSRLEIGVGSSASWLKDVENAIFELYQEAKTMSNSKASNTHQQTLAKKAISLHDFFRLGENSELLHGLESALRKSSPLIASVDLMFAFSNTKNASASPDIIVLSEIHRSIAPISFMLRCVQDKTMLIDDLARYLAQQLGDREYLNVSVYPVNKTYYMASIPGVAEIEGTSPSCSSLKSLSLDDVVINAAGYLYNTDSHSRLILLPGPWSVTSCRLKSLLMENLGLLLQIKSEERHSINHTLIRRMRWRLTLKDLPKKPSTPFETFFWVQYLRFKHGLPRWVFVRHEKISKPIFVDTSNPLCCEELLRLAARFYGEFFLLEEMIPNPDQAWAKSQYGHHMCEIRIFLAAE